MSGVAVQSDDDESVPSHYQSHCEQLVQLQRQQNERLLLADESGHTSSASGSLLNISNNSSKQLQNFSQLGAMQTRRTIDSSMAEAALSAVIKVSSSAPPSMAVKQTSVPAFVTIQEAIPGTSQMGAPVQTIRNGPGSGEF